ncbi:MAG: hypothetical protein J7K87_03760 [Candidatus Aenigmarchaeota archaeon]|nr:hypothetical protein [Candidatus Aenigmarchaeota archaeon]
MPMKNSMYYFCKKCGKYHFNPDYPGEAKPGSVFYDHFDLRNVPTEKKDREEIEWRIYKRHGEDYRGKELQMELDAMKLEKNGFEVAGMKTDDDRILLLFRPAVRE